jgi:hypothetical protein
MVLLGAGASAEAQIAVTSEMTAGIARILDEDPSSRYYGASAALNFVCGALIAHDTARGASFLEGLDVERVFSAIELLAEREELEVTPFVASWHPAVEAIDQGPATGRQGLPASFVSNLRRGLADGRSDFELERLFQDLVETTSPRQSSQVYRQLLSQMTRALRRIVHIDDPERVGYLRPLVEDVASNDPGSIATLNYDQSVELACSGNGISCSTGIDAWSAGGRCDFGTAKVHLLKLHGSVDWSMTARRDAIPATLPDNVISVSSEPLDERVDPAIVFGQRGKLRTDGPFLELLAEFESALIRATELLIIGYSFRDEHVNEYIRRWINADPIRRLTLIDPNFPERPDWRTFRGDLLTNLVPPDHAPNRFVPRLRIISENASAAIPTALGQW